MPQANTIQTSWRYGEISPLLRGRIDIDAWRHGAEKVENFIAIPQGALLRRPGLANVSSYLISGTRLSSKAIEFTASTGDNYVFAMVSGLAGTPNIKEIYKNRTLLRGPNGQRIENVTANGGLIRITLTEHGYTQNHAVVIQDVSGVANANGRFLIDFIDANTFDLQGSAFAGTYTGGGISFATGIGSGLGAMRITAISAGGEVTTSTNHSFTTGDIVGIDGVTATTSVNGQYTITVTAANKFTIGISVTGYSAGGACTNGLVQFTLPQSAATADFQAYRIAQSADILYFAHKSAKPQALSFLGDRRWEFRTLYFKDGPYLPANQSQIRFKLTSPVDSATMEDLGAAVVFVAGDVNKYVQYREDNQWKLAKVTAFTSATKVTVDILSNLLLNIDQNIKLTPKSTTSIGTSTEPVGRNAQDADVAFKRYQKQAAWTGTRTNSQPRTRQIPKEGVDYAAATSAPSVAASTTLSSDHAGTFTRFDVGKFIKASTNGAAASANVWYQITAFISHRQVTATPLTAALGTRINGASETNERNLVYYNRSITATLTASAPTNGPSPAVFVSTDVGRHVRLDFSGTKVWCRITAFTSTTQVTVEFFQDIPLDPSDTTKLANDGITTNWQLGAWSDATGYPSVVTVQEQRLTWFGTPTQPGTMWMSVSGDYYNHAPSEPDGTVLDDSAINYTIASQNAQQIIWAIPGTVLLIGTRSGEWQARASTSVMEPITPTNLSITQQGAYGSYDRHTARRIGNSVYFIQRDGRKIRKLTYSFQDDGWVSTDISIASEHIFRNGRVAVALHYQPGIFSVLWAVLSDETLACAAVDENENLYAWTHHTAGFDTTFKILDAVVDIPNNATDATTGLPTTDYAPSLHLMTARQSGSTDFLERMEPLFLPSSTTALTALTSAFVDFAQTTTLSSATQIAKGSEIQNGDLIQVWVNGVYLGEKTVAGGQIPLGGTFSGTCYYGYGYRSTLKELPPEGGSAFGTAQGKTKRIHYVAIRVFQSYKFQHGPTESDLTLQTLPSTATNFYTGDDKISLKAPYGLESGYVLSYYEPFPLNILALAPEFKTNE